MAEFAIELLRMTVRAFYHPEQVLVIDALIIHSTLSDQELASVCGTTPKPLRKWLGRLREDGLLSVQQRGERKADGTGGYFGNGGAPGKERLSHRDWYYINFHKAIDSIKFRLNRLSKYIESKNASTTERKDLSCPRCKSEYTDLEAMDYLDQYTGTFTCKKCGHDLVEVEEEQKIAENESTKRLNSQLERIIRVLRQIDTAAVPENDFEYALSRAKPIVRPDAHPGAKIEIVDDVRNKTIQSTKGKADRPEKIGLQIQDDEDAKRQTAAAEEQAKHDREAEKNALPAWITHSTVQEGEITAVGAKEEHARRQRAAHAGVAKAEDGEEKKPAASEDDVMQSYWKELAREKEAQKAEEEDDDEDEDEEDEFEDVEVGNGVAASNGMNTPLNAESSNGTDDERDAKRVRIEEPASSKLADEVMQGTPAASDEDEDELEFENV